MEYESNYFKMLSGGYDASFIYKIKGNKLYFYIDKSNGRYNNLRNLTFSNNSQKIINSFFDNPLAIFEADYYPIKKLGEEILFYFES